MLRTFFVLGILLVGLRYSFRHPFYVLLFYLWLAYFRPEDWLYWDFISPLRLSYLLGGWLVLFTVLKGVRPRFGLGPLLLFAFLGQCFVSTLFSPASSVSWQYFTEFAKVVVIGYLMIVLIDSEERLRLTLLVIGLSLGFEGAKEGWAELIRHPGMKNLNPWPMLGDNNGVAVGMLMLAPVLLTLGATASWKWERRGMKFLGVGVVYRALSTYSRGGFLACAVLGLHYLARAQKRVRAILAVAVLIALIVPVLPDAFWQRMGTIETATSTATDFGAQSESEPAQTDESVAGRLHFWAVATSMASDRPIFGVGQNAYNAVYDRYDWSFGQYGFGRSVHSSWFGVLAELGYPGLLFFVLVVGGAFVTTARVRRQALASPELARIAAYATAVEAGMLVFVVGGAFVPYQYNEMVWHFIALSMVVGQLAKARVKVQPATVPQVRITRPARPVVAAAR